jgi:aminoglycoside 6'-N-acetyltransferase I
MRPIDRLAMAVKPIGPGDLEAWQRMRCALWPHAAPAELLEEAEAYLRGASPLQAVFLGVGPAGEPWGMLELSLRSVAVGCRTTPVPYVEGWYVLRDVRRRGIGTELMDAAETWARERGYAEIASDALIDNLLSERAHLALGFVEVERAIHFRKDLQVEAATTPRSRRES